MTAASQALEPLMTTIVRSRSTEAPRGVLLAILGVALLLIGIGQALGDWAFLVSLALLLGGLGWSGVRWGSDSRDGADWKPQRPR
ncbi:MAG: hypothetical protein M3135_04630 [Actinomycetota bacterium]|nr:hypothetical protein [Actinomycetota bacterium]